MKTARGTIWLTVIALACSVVVIAMRPPAHQTPARGSAAIVVPSGSASISGTITGPDGRPLRRATVSISGDMRFARATLADDAGQFAFSDLPAGRFTLTASKAGYPQISYGASRPFRTGSALVVTDGQKLTDVNITLPAGAVITGVVLDAQGAPMQGVPILAWEVRTTLSGERTLDAPSNGSAESVTSDDRGRYRVFGLPPGDYVIGTAPWYITTGVNAGVMSDADLRAAFAATAQPGVGAPSLPAPTAPSARYNYAASFYPNTTDPIAAQTIALQAGDVRDDVNLYVQLRPVAAITGIVVGPDGKPATSIRFTVSRTSGLEAMRINMVSGTRSDGRFSTVDLPPGDYSLLAETREPATAGAMFARTEVTLDGTRPPDVTMTLAASVVVNGRLVFEGTQTPPALSQVMPALAGITPGLSRDVPAVVDPSGAFQIAGVTPGQDRLSARLPSATNALSTWTLSKVTVNGNDVTDLPVSISTGDPSTAIITLTDKRSELTGNVLTGPSRSAAEYFVVVFPADHRYWIPQSRRIVSAKPDANGRYVFPNLPPGAYRLAATTDLVTRDLSDAAALARLEQISQPVNVAEGERTTGDIRIGGG